MKSNKTLRTGIALWAALAACGPVACMKSSSETDAEVMWATAGLSGAEVESALRSKIAFRLNLKTNRATMYQDGVAVDQWNIASADVSGEWHEGVPHYTPTGVFNVEDIQMCPQWFPRNPVNPATGRKVTSEQERQRVFAQNPQVYGACGSRNPLGKYVLWFNGAYGMHGNSAEEILELPNAEDRRVSGGCIRNPNAKIRSVFNTVVNSFSELSSFAGQVKSMESRSTSDRWTLTKGTAYLNMRVVVGNWSADPKVGSSVGTRPAPTPTAKPIQPVVTPKAEPTVVPTAAPTVAPTVAPTEKPEQPAAPVPQTSTGNTSAPLQLSGLMTCNVTSVDPSSGIAPVYANVPTNGSENRVTTFYRLNWPVTVFEKVEGTSFYKVSRGYIDEKYVSNCFRSL